MPTLLLKNSKASQKIVVVDETGKVGSALVARMNSQEVETPKEQKLGRREGRTRW